jgi:predicted restriction endonuclease
MGQSRASREKSRASVETLYPLLTWLFYGYKCAICGYDRFVNCCHIKRRANTGDDSIENGIVLCPNHHYEFDYGLISLKEIKKYQVNKEKVRHSK